MKNIIISGHGVSKGREEIEMCKNCTEGTKVWHFLII